MKQLTDGRRDCLEWSPQNGRANDKNKIPSRRDLRIEQPHRFARPPLGPIAVMRLSKLLAHYKTASSATRTIARRIQAEERMAPRLAITANPPELFRTTETLVTPHGRLWKTGHKEPGIHSSHPKSVPHGLSPSGGLEPRGDARR